MRYVPENPPINIDHNLSEWLFRELLRIGNVLTITEEKDAAQDLTDASQDALLALLDQEEQAYTPIVTASSGTFTSVTSISGMYKKLGKLIVAKGRGTITTVGSATGNVFFTLPYTSANDIGSWYGSGRQDTIGGAMLQAIVNVNSNLVSLTKYDNTSPIAATAIISWTVPYWMA